MNSTHRFEQLLMNDISAPRLISILSGKGGVGKSILAVNIAERLSAMGERVLLVDADISGGNLHILTNSGCDHSLEEFIEGSISLSEVITNTDHGIDLLASLFDPAKQDLETVTNAITLVRRLRVEANDYDTVVIDHSSGISKFATVIANASDISLLVLIPELTSVADCFGLLKYLYSVNPSIDCRLLVNRVDSLEEAQVLQERFTKATQQFLGKSPLIMPSISEDTTFRKSVARQVPLAVVDPQANAIQELTKICRLLSITKTEQSSDLLDERINIKPANADIRG